MHSQECWAARATDGLWRQEGAGPGGRGAGRVRGRAGCASRLTALAPACRV